MLVDVLTTLTYRHPTLIFVDENRCFPIPGASLRLPGDKYIQQGCDAPQLVRDVLALLADQKLRVLQARLAHTMQKIDAKVTSVS